MALSDFRRLLTYYLDQAISTDTFMYRFDDLRKRDRTWMGPAQDSLSQMFHALDDYVPHSASERTDDAIDERELRRVATRVMERISGIDDSETHQFETSSDVIRGLADSDPEVRRHSAVIATEFPGDPAVIAALRAGLNDADSRVRLKTVGSLGKLVDLPSFNAIVDVLDSADDPFSEAWAVANLAAYEPSLRPRARAAIASWAKRHDTPFSAQTLAQYMRLIGDDDD
jgi:hypothetical protein